jgi:hypothetical protein
MDPELRERLGEWEFERLRLRVLTETVWFLLDYLVPVVGSEEAMKRMGPALNGSGHAFAHNISEMFKLEGDDLEKIHLISNLYNDIFGGGAATTVESTDSSFTVHCSRDCPGCGGPMEYCRMHPLVLNGICEHINPEYHVVFTRMRAEGNPACVWVCEKRSAGCQR